MESATKHTLPRHVRLPHNVYAAVKETSDGQWNWSLKMRKKEIATGSAETERGAWKKLRGKMELLVDVARKAGAKNATRQKLRSWCERRPYLVSHVLAMLAHGQKEGEIINRAADEEKALHDLELKNCGFAWPLPTHANAKSPQEAAGIVLGLCRELQLEGKRAFNFGSKAFGMAFSNPEAEDHVQVTRRSKEYDNED